MIGSVIDTLPTKNGVWIAVETATTSERRNAARLVIQTKTTSKTRSISIGDTIRWAGTKVMWSPSYVEPRVFYPIQRIGRTRSPDAFFRLRACVDRGRV